MTDPTRPDAPTETPSPEEEGPNFVADLVAADVAAGKHGGKVVTRFPPEPNGYLHIGHAKAIVLDFEIAKRFGGRCNLRFDDTNPEAESVEFVEAIRRDVRWLGYDWGEHEYFASDYFERLYEWAKVLIRKGLAYVDSQTPEQIRLNRGDYHRPGTNSPFRDRSVEENLALFEKMRAGEMAEGEAVLRAKIDMAHPNVVMRDPLMYRIRHVPHHRTGNRWCIYPMYDWAHGQSDAIEGVTHSLCTLEFEDHRPLYDWFLEALEIDPRPRQIEFARLNLTYTVLSKRRLLQLVQGGHVDGWDDPRMPTLSGMRRRGFPPEAIRRFCRRIGVSKREGVVDVTLLEHMVRDHLEHTAPRAMAVLDPLKVVIDNYPEDAEESFEAPNHPTDPSFGTRTLPFCRELWIDRKDFMLDPPRKYHRLAPGREVRLRYACLVTCTDVECDADGRPTVVHCTFDPASRGGTAPDGRKVRGTIHWVSARHAVRGECRLYDRLFDVENPQGEDDFLAHLNPASRVVVENAMLEPSLAGLEPGTRRQFERTGYFVVDPDSTPERPVWNRTIALKDTWAKMVARGATG
ncbi:MAG: glutamine--tRNA ligase/YqeY domain fusion protein [Deltaproteobacteria bacterium]|nr:MAG: glutamine--tRNA ligase/YqeY domain fusion protein [Deltaproteobacteria bacterium]